MLVITALYNTPDRDYAMLMLNLEKSVKKLGYSFNAYLLKEDPMVRFSKKDNYFAPCFFKPSVIKTALTDQKDDVLWLDSDCLMKDRVDEMLDDCDLSVTLRRFNKIQLRDIYDGYINAGVMAFRNNNQAKGFIDRWIGNFPDSRADQDAMNLTLLGYSPLMQYGEIIDVDGVKVKILDCDTYNFFYFEDSEEIINKAKIFHIKGHLRPQFYAKIKEKVLKGV